MTSRFPSATGAFEVPSIGDAAELFKVLRPSWGGWMESGLDGTFVVVPVPERISELNQLLAEAESWITRQSFLAIRFHLDGRVYILQRGGLIRRAGHAQEQSE